MKGYDDSSETKYIEHTVVNDFVSAVFPFHAPRHTDQKLLFKRTPIYISPY